MSAPFVAQPLCCPGCGAAYEQQAVNLALELATCGTCRRVLDLGGPRGGRPDKLAPRREKVMMPRGVRVDEAASVAEIRMPRSFPSLRLKSSINALGLLIPAGFVVAAMHPPPAIAAGAAAVGLLLLGAAIFRRPLIRVRPSGLEVRSGGLPLLGGLDLAFDRAQVHQIFCERHDTPDANGTVVKSSFAVSALVGDQRRRVVLVSELDDAKQALWLEQALEETLGIEDAPVGGELER